MCILDKGLYYMWNSILLFKKVFNIKLDCMNMYKGNINGEW